MLIICIKIRIRIEFTSCRTKLSIYLLNNKKRTINISIDPKQDDTNSFMLQIELEYEIKILFLKVPICQIRSLLLPQWKPQGSGILCKYVNWVLLATLATRFYLHPLVEMQNIEVLMVASAIASILKTCSQNLVCLRSSNV